MAASLITVFGPAIVNAIFSLVLNTATTSSSPAPTATPATSASSASVVTPAAATPAAAAETAPPTSNGAPSLASPTPPATILVDCLLSNGGPDVARCVGDRLTVGQLRACIADRFGTQCFGFLPADAIRKNLIAALGAELRAITATSSHQAQVLGYCLAHYQAAANIAACVAENLTVNELQACIASAFGPECFGFKPDDTIIEYLRGGLFVAIGSQIKGK